MGGEDGTNANGVIGIEHDDGVVMEVGGKDGREEVEYGTVRELTVVHVLVGDCRLVDPREMRLRSVTEG